MWIWSKKRKKSQKIVDLAWTSLQHSVKGLRTQLHVHDDNYRFSGWKPFISEKIDDFKEYSSEESENGEESEEEKESDDKPESDDEGGYDIQFVLPKFLQKGIRYADS